MDEKLKIKISIADRVYPLTVELNQKKVLGALQKKLMLWCNLKKTMLFDKQDVLAMCALQFASQSEQKQIDNATETKLLKIKKSMPS
jgi:cell division protein ZapA